MTSFNGRLAKINPQPANTEAKRSSSFMSSPNAVSLNIEEWIARFHADLPQINQGKVADYIPELAHVDASKFGVHIVTVDLEHSYSYGDAAEGFSVQSIAKMISLTMAYQREQGDLWKRVGVEPSGTSFNSLIQLESDKGIPRNPMVNAGALVICDVLLDHLVDPKNELLSFVRSLSGDQSIGFNEKVAASELAHSARNRAKVEYIRSFGNIHNETDKILDFYCNLCALEMNCSQLARTFLFLANEGISPMTQEPIVSKGMAKRLNAIMQMCGLYDEAGEFAYRVGLPGKSGVGGGVVALLPGQYCVAVWSPPLNLKGNSQHGMMFLERFTSEVGNSIF